MLRLEGLLAVIAASRTIFCCIDTDIVYTLLSEFKLACI